MRTEFNYSGTELEAMALAQNYQRWILSQFAPYLGKRVIEVGAGIGTFSRLLLNDCDISELIALEPAENLFPLLRNQLAPFSRAHIRQEYFENLPVTQSADSILLVNVLEHVADDIRLLRVAHRILEPAGTLLLFVPALPWLSGTLDKAFEHQRRYTRSRLAEKLHNTGFRTETLRYINLPGIASWFITGRVLQRRTLKPRDVQLYDRWVVPWISRLERFWEPPVGQSLIAVARKPQTQALEETA